MTPAKAYQTERIAHWNAVASNRKPRFNGGKYYHQRLKEIYSHLIPQGSRVLEIGCGCGDLLAAVRPSMGVGVDFSYYFLARARKKYPGMHFALCDGHHLCLNAAFDAVILSDLVNDVWDVQLLLQELKKVGTPKTRIFLNFYSRVWELPLNIAAFLEMSVTKLRQNWLTKEDMVGLLGLSDFEMISSWREVLFPAPLPVINPLCNKILVKIWPFSHLAITNIVSARPRYIVPPLPQPSVSVIIPARNEAGSIRRIFDSMPVMGKDMEIIFVEGHSKDKTYEAIEEAIGRHPLPRCRLLRQKGKGKGDAVREGFSHARGDVLMILDADLTVPAEDLLRFYDAIKSGKGEFINGVRLVYPLEKGAMQFFNFLANKFFCLTFSWLLGQPIKDALCGTKVLWKSDYELIVKNRDYFGDFDPFGDFDLLFGAARLHLKIIDMPIRYQERDYGTTNVSRWRHGFLLFRMVAFALNKIKFI